MHGSEYIFPPRIPEECLIKIYPSVETAFSSHDYLYVARYGKASPELHGCSLLMLGNKVGGERILDQSNIKTARSYLYRAYISWQNDEQDKTEYWISEGLNAGGEDVKLNKFIELTKRNSFRVLIYGAEHQWDSTIELKKIPWIELINTESHLLPDLVLAHDLKSSKENLNASGAPVVATTGDHEWYYDRLDEMLNKVDWIAAPCTTDATEIAHVFGKRFLFTNYLWNRGSSSDLYESFTDKASRKIDLLFTGGITHDFYRDKRQRILSLAYALPKQFKVKFLQSLFSFDLYQKLLREARFTVTSMRNTNNVTSRNIEALSMGVINLVSEANGMPFLFSEPFACFQNYKHENYIRDIRSHLARYDEIIEEFKPQIKQFEAEFYCLFPDKSVWWRRYLRRLLFVTQVTDNRKLMSKPASSISSSADPLLRMALERSQDPTISNLEILYLIEEGIKLYPNSLPLNYSRGLLLRNAGRYSEAEELFGRIVREQNYSIKQNEPFPYQWDRLFGSYWIIDARIRERCTDFLKPLVSEVTVWKSFSLSHLADLMLMQTFSDLETKDILREHLIKVAALAKEAMSLFIHNDTAHRLYLRAAYKLYSLGLKDWGEEFLCAYEYAKIVDGRILNDFAAMVFCLLTDAQRFGEAANVKESVILFLGRVNINRSQYFLYPEALPLLKKYNLPHGALVKL